MFFEKLKFHFLNIVNKNLYQSRYKRNCAIDIVKNHDKSKVNSEISNNLIKKLIKYSIHSNEKILEHFDSSLNGLSEKKVEELQDEYGLNEINFTKLRSWWSDLWQSYRNPFNILLTFLAIFQIIVDDKIAAIIIIIMVIVATLMRFIQEKRSKIAMDKLKIMVSNTTTVIRQYEDEVLNNKDSHNTSQGVVKEVAITELVPGDIVTLSAGDMIPADIRVLTAKDLFISQSVLTGESMPVEKFSEPNNDNPTNILSLDNIAFMGSNVVSGSAKGIVLSTGNNTYFGNLASKLTATESTPNQFQVGINKVSLLLIKFMLIMVPIILLVNGFTKGNWLDAALFALSVAVGLTPEMLPMIVTSTLAKGATFMAKKKIIVKKLEALQNFGAMDILCTDKTGTLTQDKIVLERHTDIFGHTFNTVLDYAYLNSFYQTGLKNLLDVAVLKHAEVNKKLDIAHNYQKVDEIPFDFNRRRMSVVVREENDHNLLICKGALEEILAVSSFVRENNKDIPITENVLKELTKTTNELNEEGLRIVAVAIKKDAVNKEVYSIDDEAGLTLIGYIAFLDPPKESTENALKALENNGVKVKILTGDNELVTKKVCKDVKFDIKGVLTGNDISLMSDQELVKIIDDTNVFVKLTPDHKERIVNILKMKEHVVGFMGDGINDAPALRAADVGISVDSAVDIAKESADLVLLEKSLMVLEQGIKEGRRTFANMLKYIRMTASSNFGNVFSVLIASIFLPFLPMLPLQILIQNLLYDTSQVVIPFDNVDEETLKKPQRWNPYSLLRFIISFGPLSSIFDIITFLVIWFIYKINTPDLAPFFQTGWFLESLISQVLVVHAIRTMKVPFFTSIAAPSLLIMGSIIIVIGILIPLTALGSALGFVQMPFSYYGFVILIVTSYFLLAQVVKTFYVKKFAWN